MASASSTPASSILITFVIIILLVISRIVRNFRGVCVSIGRTIGYIVFYFAFGMFFVIPSFFEGVPIYYAALDVVGLVIAAVISHNLADRRLVFWRAADGSIWYKGGIIIYLIYVAGLIARLSVDFLVVGPSAFSFNFGGSLSPAALIGTTVTDLLLMFGVGLLIGRNIRVYQRYKKIQEGKETLPPAP